MANRKKSDVPQHETIPGPGPGSGDAADAGDAGDGGSGIHPVEQMVDAAIDRIAREHRASGDGQSRHALAVRSSRPAANGRLHWKGLDVSDEFRRYAERIAQGEDLPPYEGKILAEPNPTFPWEPSARRHASRRAVRLQVGAWGSAAVVLGLIGWSLAVKYGGAGAAPLQATQSAPSEAVLSVHATPRAHEPESPEPSELEADDTLSASPSGATALVAASEDSSAARQTPTVPPVDARTAPRPVVPRQDIVSIPARSDEAEPPPHVPPPGALREALGALLAARAAPAEFPNADSPEGHADNRSATAPAVATPSPLPPPVTSPGAVGNDGSPVAGRPPSVATESVGAGPVRKAPGNESSAKGSLLVEKPPF